jgi:D-amino-acid dehydrogenase
LKDFAGGLKYELSNLINGATASVMSDHIIIIGAGVVGAASALALQADGHNITLVDRQAPCAGASFGNAGVIVNGSCVPTAMPGILFDVLRMASQPLPPLSIRASYALKILPWLTRFVWQSRAAAVASNAKHLHALTRHGVTSWHQLTANTALAAGLASGVGLLKPEQSGTLCVRTPASRHEPGCDHRAAYRRPGRGPGAGSGYASLSG